MPQAKLFRAFFQFDFINPNLSGAVKQDTVNDLLAALGYFYFYGILTPILHNS